MFNIICAAIPAPIAAVRHVLSLFRCPLWRAWAMRQEEACFTALGADDLLLDESAPKSEALPTKLWPEAERYNVQVKTVDIITQVPVWLIAETPLLPRGPHHTLRS